MSGTYRTRDSRENKYSRIAAIDVVIRPKRGSAEILREDGRRYKLNLWTCKIANISQTHNFGRPFEAVESLVRCEILSNYKHASIYVGKVKRGYTISDPKMLKTFDPMQVSTGYVIVVKENLAGEVWLSVSKD